jgi:hypothetical protein
MVGYIRLDPVGNRIARLPDRVSNILQRELASWLMANPYEWRERRVEHLSPLDSRLYSSRISLQFRIQPEAVRTTFALARDKEARLGGGAQSC